jgi:putative ABC transport system permease protein
LPAFSAAREEPADAVRRVPLVRGWVGRAVQVVAIAVLLLLCFLATHYRDALPRRAGAFAGSICLMLAGLVTTPLLTTVVGRFFQPLFRHLLGLEGRLAADNLVRSTNRIGIVIAALTATTALLVQTAGFVVSSEEAILHWIDHKVAADLFVTGGAAVEDSGKQVPIAETVAGEIKGLPDVEAVVGGRVHALHFRGRLILLIAVDTDDWERVDKRFMSGKMHRLRRDRRALGLPPPVVVSENFAALYGFKKPEDASNGPSQRFAIPTRDGDVELELVDTVEDYLWNRGVVIVDRAWYRETFQDHKIDVYDVFLKPGTDREAARGRLAVWGKGRVLYVATRDKLRNEISSGLRRLYSLAYAQQVLVGMVALLGLISALFISVLQRTREFGLLRAVGATRAQILRSVLAEASLMALIGAVLGLVLGFVLEWYLLDVLLLDEAGFLFPLRFPWVAAGVVALASVVTATLVGLWPAWRATQLRIPEAIAYE